MLYFVVMSCYFTITIASFRKGLDLMCHIPSFLYHKNIIQSDRIASWQCDPRHSCDKSHHIVRQWLLQYIRHLLLPHRWPPTMVLLLVGVVRQSSWQEKFFQMRFCCSVSYKCLLEQSQVGCKHMCGVFIHVRIDPYTLMPVSAC